MKSNKKIGEVRVGKITFPSGKPKKPKFPFFSTIEVMMKSSKYGDIGPYELKDEKGRIMENIWQFSKIYEKVPEITEYYSRFDRTINWKYHNEIHLKNIENDSYEILPEYWEWRKKGMENPFKVRYPVGKSNTKECFGCISEKEVDKKEIQLLDYIEARKEIYMKTYIDLVKNHPTFIKLKERLKKGENLLIIEVDGPHQEALDYYINKYKVKKDFIENGTMMATKENLDIMLNDSKFSFGHGYCLAAALLELNLN